VVSCHELGVQDLFDILKNSEGSIMRQYVNAFEAYGIDLIPTDPGLYRIAQKSHEEHTGARSLVGVCERTFREYKYNLPHSSVNRLELNERLVDHPDDVLREILQSAKATQLERMASEVNVIAEEWSRRNGIQIRLQPEAARLLSQRALDSGDKLADVFSETFKDYEHGLNLIRRTQGIQQFEITADAIRDPRATLDRWIRAYYING
jgi:ATP-dependent Clp protease ATP-binding subunit ClpX